jgi:ribosomal protein S2
MIKTNKTMKNFIHTTKKTINILLVNFTFAKFAAALITIIMVALIKLMVSGDLHIEYCEFGNNVALGLLG